MFMTLYDCSLYDYYNNQRKLGRERFTLEQLHSYLSAIVNGVFVLHQNLIVHRDLKAANVFVHLDPHGEIQQLVVADYDTAVQLPDADFRLHETFGTPGFMPEEALNAKEIGYGLSVDGMF
jgi:serine/threonine protein kinase